MQPQLSTGECTSWLVAHDPIEVIAWDDELVEQHGHAPRSAYVETYWLPVLGPSSTWAMRRLTAWLDVAPDGYNVTIAELGRELGLGAGTGRSSPVVRTLSRLVSFGLATPRGDALAVRRMLAPLTCRQVRSLPEPLAAQHDRDRDAERISNRPPTMTSVAAGGVLCRSAVASEITGVVGNGHSGDAGGVAAWSGKPTAAPLADHPALAAHENQAGHGRFAERGAR